MEVLRDRKSTREFSAQPVNREQLANLLWAGFGVNRPETGQRTAPLHNEPALDRHLRSDH